MTKGLRTSAGLLLGGDGPKRVSKALSSLLSFSLSLS